VQILKNVDELSNFIEATDVKACLADTSFLYGTSFDDDRLFQVSNDVLDVLSKSEVGIYANVISRMEFVDLIFRKQITLGAIRLFNSVDSSTENRPLFNILKNIRDQNTAAKNKGRSYKVGEPRLKRLRHELEAASDASSWREFCHNYVGELLVNEWGMLEDDLGLDFIEVLENETSEFFEQPLLWSDMVRLMGSQGLRGRDAMILNLFSKSNLSLLITGDSDFEIGTMDDFEGDTKKAIYIL